MINYYRFQLPLLEQEISKSYKYSVALTSGALYIEDVLSTKGGLITDVIFTANFEKSGVMSEKNACIVRDYLNANNYEAKVLRTVHTVRRTVEIEG